MEIMPNETMLCTVGVYHNPKPLQSMDSNIKVIRYSCEKKACLAVLTICVIVSHKTPQCWEGRLHSVFTHF